MGTVAAENAVATGVYDAFGAAPSVHRLLDASSPFVSRSGATLLRSNRLTNEADCPGFGSWPLVIDGAILQPRPRAERAQP